MNTLDPLELALLIEKNFITEHGLLEVVLCLRQQQAEIEALTQYLDETCQIGKFIVWSSTDKELK